MCGNFLDGFFSFVATIIAALILVIFVLVVMLFFGKSENEYREIVINELCQKKQYDFCEVASYKLKTEEVK